MSINLMQIAFEFAIGLYSLFLIREWNLKLFFWQTIVILFSICAVVSLVAGGMYALAGILKLFLFLLVFRVGRKKKMASAILVIFLIVLNQIVAAVEGIFLTKWAVFPFLVCASCVYILRNDHNTRWLIGLMAVACMGELLQAWIVGSRGVLLTVVLTLLLTVLPGSLYRTLVASVCRYFPIVYPVALSFILLSFVLGVEVLEPTASNVERSALSFWSIQMMPEYVHYGPGPREFFDVVNGVLETAGRQREDDGIDPHSFLLSIWVSQGVLIMIVAFITWFSAWGEFKGDPPVNRWQDRLTLSVLVVNSVVNFTVSPPDSYMRCFVALLLGLTFQLSKSVGGGK